MEGRESRALPPYIRIDRSVGEQSGIIRIFHRDKDTSRAKGTHSPCLQLEFFQIIAIIG